MPTPFSTLTIDLTSLASGTRAEFTVRVPGGESAEEFEPDTITLPSELPALQSGQDLKAYTIALSTAVFGERNGAIALEKAWTGAQIVNVPLRVRVSVGEDTDLARHHWELLGNPRDDFSEFARGERSCFARYFRDTRTRTLPLTSGKVRTIALLANPTDLDQMMPIEAAEERAVISGALGDTQIRRLVSPRATFPSLRRELAQGADVLVLTCHGHLHEGQPLLFFEREGQRADTVKAKELADFIGSMATPPPRLVVLASCDSAGTGDTTFRDDGGFFSSSAVALIKAGVPAVVGMQGAVSRDTARTFIKAFFQHLLNHGHVELATAAARTAIPREEDWWVASLLVAVEDGVLWADGPPRPFPYWRQVLQALDRQECTAILGSEMIERLSNRNLAKFFAEQVRRKHRGPSPELARISQQLRLEIGRDVLGNVLTDFYATVQREDGVVTRERDLVRSVSVWGKAMLPDPELNPYLDLAELPIALYITTNPDDLLSDALKSVGKSPQTLVCPWRNDNPGHLDLPDTPPPTVEQPVVYQLFGHLSDPNSVVLTEDDFFDHLVWLARHSARTIPPQIPLQLAQTSLLFLGFQLEDWEFRVMLRGLMRMQMVHMFSKRIHVAVQLDPRDLSQKEQEEAVRALEDHFRGTEVRLEIYWGTVESFLRQLRHEREKRDSQAGIRTGAS